MQEAASLNTNTSTECKFRCANGNCLAFISLICDQLNNCGDNSDEEDCPALTQHPPSALFNSELQFVQIIIVMVVMAAMVVVIICLLNLYKFSTWSYISRQSQGERQHEGIQQVTCAWSMDGIAPTRGASQMTSGQHSRVRFTAHPFMQRDPFCRFQPTYPPRQDQIDLPPTICLSDGEDPPPYQGPCTLQLRDPEQQMELSRESVRAPPNRTIFDSDLINVLPPSSNSGISATRSASHRDVEGRPPTYSDVVGKPPGRPFTLHQHDDTPPSQQGAAARVNPPNNSANTMVSIMAKNRLV